MMTEQQEFAGWSLDPYGETTRSLWATRLTKIVSSICVALLAVWYILHKTQMIPFHQEIPAALIVIAVSAELMSGHTKRTALSESLACKKCGKAMEVVETLPQREAEHAVPDVFYGASGHAYQLRQVTWLPKPDAYEVRLQWRACRNCKRYVPVPDVKMIKMGIGQEAIDAQEKTYMNFATILEKMAANGSAKGGAATARVRSRKPSIAVSRKTGIRRAQSDTRCVSNVTRSDSNQ